MKLGLIGLPGAGKTTVFGALGGARGVKDGPLHGRADQRIATVNVPDPRVDFLSSLFQPKKTTFAKVEYLLPSQTPGVSSIKAETEIWNQARVCDGLLHVVRNFQGAEAPRPEQDFRKLEEDMILNDLAVAEKRIERIELDSKRGKKPEGDELDLVQRSLEILERGEPVRNHQELANSPELRGFTFLSAKPMLVIVNNDDENQELPLWENMPEQVDMLIVRGRLEMDLAFMGPGEAKEFQEAYNINELALDRVIRRSYRLLRRISFFTIGDDEVKAWSIPAGTPALEAAGAVHTDMKKGFIRAEVLAFDDLKACGNMREAKKAGLMRLEGKEYIVKDGDIINFRFNV